MTDLDELLHVAQQHLLEGGPMPALLGTALAPPAEARWDIYREAYRLRLVSSLATTYDALAARLGRVAFGALALEFIEANPSTFRSLRDYGGGFAAMLAGRARDAETRLEAELAAFEWTLAAAFDAADHAPTTVDELAVLLPAEWPRLRFRATPGLGRLRTTTNAVEAWRSARAAVEAGASGEEPVADPVATEGAPVEWLVVRPALETRFRSLPADEAAALDAVLAGTSFEELGEALAAEHGDSAALVAATWLKGWLTEGALLRV